MRKIIAAINMTIDGICDHTSIIPDEEIHEHYRELLSGADAILYGRITYQLMEFWQNLVKNPSGEKSMDDFALAMDKIPKIVFSNTMNVTDWESAVIAKRYLKEEVLILREQPGKNIFIGSRSLILQLLKLDLIDEFQLCIHPVIAGNGLQLFENFNERIIFKLRKTKNFSSGAVVHYYEKVNEF